MSDEPEQTDPPSRLQPATEQQRDVIDTIARALGFAAMRTWDECATWRTAGLKFSEMTAAAHVHSLGRLLAGALEQVPDGDARLEELLALMDEMLRDVFAHARAQLLAESQALPADELPHAKGCGCDRCEAAARAAPVRVIVPAPKLLM